jgi:hypothetical protein
VGVCVLPPFALDSGALDLDTDDVGLDVVLP